MYKIGLIGYGGFGEFLHTHWSRIDGLEVAVIHDVRSDLIVDGVRVVHDLESFLASDIDIVSIATPPSSHVGIALMAIRAGKHVLIEKPMAMTRTEAEELLAESARIGVKISTNYMLRFNPLVRLVKDVVLRGLAGKLLYVSVTNVAQDESLPVDHWFWDKSVSGGIFIEHAVHFFDMVYYISGEAAVSARGFSSWRNDRQEDRVLGVVKHDKGLLASHFHAFCRPGFLEETNLRFVFERGELELHGWIPLEGFYSGLCTSDLKNLLLSLDYGDIRQERSVVELEDHSRPKGWGDLAAKQGRLGADAEMGYAQLGFGLNHSKSEVYGDCVRSSLLDLTGQIEGAETCVLSADSLLEAVGVAELVSAGED